MHETTLAFLIHSKHSTVEFTDKALLNRNPTKKLVWQKTISTNVKRIAPQHDSLVICMSFLNACGLKPKRQLLNTSHRLRTRAKQSTRISLTIETDTAITNTSNTPHQMSNHIVQTKWLAVRIPCESIVLEKKQNKNTNMIRHSKQFVHMHKPTITATSKIWDPTPLWIARW